MGQERQRGVSRRKRHPRKEPKQQTPISIRDVAIPDDKTEISSWVDDPCDEWDVAAADENRCENSGYGREVVRRFRFTSPPASF